MGMHSFWNLLLQEGLAGLRFLSLPAGTRVAVAPETRCQTPLIPEQGIMSCKHHLGRFGVNTTCYFACKTGFTLSGQSQLRCRDSGRWTTHVPVCRGEWD